jgi:hypothetical protein
MRGLLLLAAFIALAWAFIPQGKPLDFYARNGSAYGVINFTNVVQGGFGMINLGQVPNTFSVDTNLGFVWRTPITVQWTYINGTYTILPNFDALGNLIGFSCYYDPQKPYIVPGNPNVGEIYDHSTVVKIEGKFLIPRPKAPHGNQRDMTSANTLYRPGQVRKTANGYEITDSARRARDVQLRDSDSAGYTMSDYYFGWSRDAAACNGALGWAIWTDPDTDRFIRIDYSGNNIAPFVYGDGRTPCCLGATIPIGTGLYKFFSTSDQSDTAALTLDPMCYAGSPALATERYCDLGCHM